MKNMRYQKKMVKVSKSCTLSITIKRDAKTVYSFVINPKNLPKWATAFCKAVHKSGSDWIVTTMQGEVKIRFTKRNNFGIADHFVYPSTKVEIYIPLRIIRNGSGCEVVFTLFKQPEMTESQFKEDIKLVEQDLSSLKKTLED